MPRSAMQGILYQSIVNFTLTVSTEDRIGNSLCLSGDRDARNLGVHPA